VGLQAAANTAEYEHLAELAKQAWSAAPSALVSHRAPFFMLLSGKDRDQALQAPASNPATCNAWRVTPLYYFAAKRFGGQPLWMLVAIKVSI